MKKFILFAFTLFIHIAVYGDAEAQCRRLFDKSTKEVEAQNYAKSLEYLAEAKTIADNNNLSMMQIGYLIRMARVYTEILDFEKAMECYMEAYQIAIKEPQTNYKKSEIRVLNNISGLYSANKEYGKAKEYLRKAYHGAVQIQDSLLAGGSATNLASCANQMGDLEEAEKYLNIAMTMLKNQTIDSVLLLITKGVRMENLYLKGEYNKAEQLVLEILDQNLTVMDNNIQVESLLRLSQIYQKKKDYQQAIKVGKEALDQSQNLLIVIEIHEHLSNLYLDMEEPNLAIQHLKSMINAKDSLNKITDMKNIKLNQVKFDLINAEKALAESRAKQKEDRMFFILGMGIIGLVVLIWVWIFLMKSAKNKRLKVVAELELEKQINEKLLLERQLTTKILHQSNRNELLKETIRTLTKIPHSDDPTPILKSVIRKLKAQIKESADSNNSLIHFEKINPSFLSALKEKHPDLTAKDIRLVSYIYLNLDTKEISTLFNITPEYCQKKKYRLAQKMNLTTAEMYGYLTNLEKKGKKRKGGKG